MARILIVVGTRPEAIKMAPVVHALRRHGSLETLVAVTAQHRAMLDQVLQFAAIAPDVDLDLMEPDQSPCGLSSRILDALGPVLARLRPDRVLVHGDTVTTMAAALASSFHKIPVGHVEAGLRSGDNLAPWPEEINRKIVGAIADLHFAPTQGAADALRAENVAETSIHITGNTVIDALLAARAAIADDPRLAAGLDPLAERFAGRRIITVTSHRRENLGVGMAGIGAAIARIAQREDIAIVFPVHPNPAVRAAMPASLSHHPRVAMIDPLDYPHFVRLMEMSAILLTDSGGLQEEASALGKPVLVMRDTTERPEGIAAGVALLVGTDQDRIVSETNSLLDDARNHAQMAAARTIYGDGKAAERIARILMEKHGGA